ncbi:four helix bundle protein [Aestuariicella hydrocarbonica]|uniref:Four helix bundle protein n=1 Tax=Pseudomaricurvus hydrocarbonicus TaxID=1470433 RepID=A0A9E5T525_9GAMM|nr:four helix bundle protein [Aestuariicella hydrocarbonica]NHO68522.1 four helix bundle protein [Aestuariicella hydrocarbonica]
MLYENLEVWKRSRALAIQVYQTLSHCRDFGFKDQITRSALSVPSNIAEGCERMSGKERRRFLDIAKGSIGEFKTQADIGIAVGFIPDEIGKRWLAEASELSKMLKGLIRSVKD